MNIIDSQKMVYVDCDDSLVMWDLSSYDQEEFPRMEIDVGWSVITVVPNQKNINLVHKLHKMGHTIVIWSQTGGDYAAHIAKALGLGDIVSLAITKPKYIIDDMPPKVWIGQNIYRNIRDEKTS